MATFEKNFETFKKELDKRNTAELPADLAMQVTMTDEEGGGTFYVANIDNNFAVEPYDYVDNTVAIAAPVKVLKDLLAGKVDGPDALFRGLIDVNGNTAHALAVLGLKKKTAAKKPAAKKTAAKKPAAKKTTTTKKAAEKKTTTTKKAAEKKTTTTKKAAEKKTTTKAAAEKKTATKTAAKKPAAKKTTTTKKTAAKK